MFLMTKERAQNLAKLGKKNKLKSKSFLFKKIISSKSQHFFLQFAETVKNSMYYQTFSEHLIDINLIFDIKQNIFVE